MILLLLILLLLNNILLSNSIVVKYDSIINTYSYSNIITSFGMAKDGIITINYRLDLTNNNNNNNNNNLNEYYLLMVIVTQSQKVGWYSFTINNNNDDDGTIATNILQLCNSPSQSRYNLNINNNGNYTYKIPSNDLYSILLFQCYNGNPLTSLKVELDVSLINIRPINDNSKYTQFAIEEVMVPRVIDAEIILYTIFILGLIFQLYMNKRYVKIVHFFYLLTLIFMIIQLISRHYQLNEIEILGYSSIKMLLAYNITSHISNVISLATLFIISLGLNFGHNVLLREKKFGFIAITSYFIIGFGGACCTEATDQCKSLWLVSYVMRSIVLLGIIVAMNYSVAQLRAIIINSAWAPSTPWHYHKLQQYQIFRFIFLIYLILPTIFITIQSTLFTWKDNWMIFLMTELLTLFIYLHVGINFAPDRDDFNRAFDGTYNNRERID